MGRSPYQGEKRRKELARLKKQEEKRQKRFNKKHGTSESAEGAGSEGQPVDAPEAGMAPEGGSSPSDGRDSTPSDGSPVDQTSQPEPAPQASDESQRGGQQS